MCLYRNAKHYRLRSKNIFVTTSYALPFKVVLVSDSQAVSAEISKLSRKEKNIFQQIFHCTPHPQPSSFVGDPQGSMLALHLYVPLSHIIFYTVATRIIYLYNQSWDRTANPGRTAPPAEPQPPCVDAKW